MNAIVFKSVTKHSKFEFMPGVPVAFEDPDAVPYFVDGMHWADRTDAAPVRVYSQEEVSIDPMAVDGATGKLVLTGADGSNPGVLTPGK